MKMRNLGSLLILLLSSTALSAQPIHPRPRLAVDLAPGSVSEPYHPGEMVTLRGELFFNTAQGYGVDLYRSDLTPEGTRVAADVCPGCSDNVRSLAPVGDRLFFEACDSIRGCQLWVTRSSTVGDAERLTDFPFGRNTYGRGFVTAWGEKAVYALYTGEVWVSDGTADGTVLLTDAPLWQPHAVAAADNLFIFAQHTLWWSDGLRVEERATVNAELSSQQGRWLVVGDRVFFIDWTDSTSTLQVSDDKGTSTVLELPRDGETLVYPLLYTDGVRAFFAISKKVDGAWKSQLWQSDGRPEGTRPVLNGTSVIDVSRSSYDEVRLAEIYDGRLYFTVPASSQAPYADKLLSIGIGTDDVRVAGELPGRVRHMIASGSDLYLVLERERWDMDLYRSSGPPETLVPLFSLGSAVPSAAVATPRGVAWATRDGLVTSDGTAAGTRRLVGAPEPASARPGQFRQHRGQLLFSAYSPASPPAYPSPWMGLTDGTAEGTRKIADRHLLPVSAGGQTFFFEREFWWPRLDVLSDDGSLAQLLDENQVWGTGFSAARELNGFLYFVAYAVQGPFQLWRSDGTPDGTQVVGDTPADHFCPIEWCGVLTESVDHHGILFLSIENTLWRSNGIPEGEAPGITTGTRLIATAEELCNCEWARLGGLQTAGDRVFFSVVSSGAHQLWTFDDTHGLTLVREWETSFDYPATAAAGDRIVFTFRDNANRTELWGSDGTAAGTRRLQNLVLGPFPAGWPALTSFAGRVFFSADDGVHGQELWMTDGTEAGTRLYADLYPGPEPGAPRAFKAIGGRLFFAADNGVHGVEPWVITPNVLNPRRLNRPSFVGDLYPGPLSSSPAGLMLVGNKVFFSAYDPEAGRELWSLDLGGRVFRDGFESGGLSAWSITVGK